MLLRALTTLDAGQEWLLKPQQVGDDPCLWSPGIKFGVAPGSWFHRAECFGPVLGLMCARNLDEAVALQNDVPYGLTAGFHSLDELEIADWKRKVEAGNLYINRGITGAIVQRQPFGGWKRSSIGPGAKAGGPNYVNLLRHLSNTTEADIDAIERGYLSSWEKHFSKSHDPSALRCESNDFRYRPSNGVILRLPDDRQAADKAEALAGYAAELVGVPLIISHATDESDEEFALHLPQIAKQIDCEFFRTIDSLNPPCDEILRAVHRANLNWIDAPFSNNGRIELTRWTREQSVTETQHRYGNVLRGDQSV